MRFDLPKSVIPRSLAAAAALLGLVACNPAASEKPGAASVPGAAAPQAGAAATAPTPSADGAAQPPEAADSATPQPSPDAAKASDTAAHAKAAALPPPAGHVWRHPEGLFELHAPADWKPVRERQDRIVFVLPPEAIGENPRAGGTPSKKGQGKEGAGGGAKGSEGDGRTAEDGTPFVGNPDQAADKDRKDPLAGIDPKYVLTLSFAVYPKTEGQPPPSLAFVLQTLADQKQQFGGYELMQSQPGRDLGTVKNHRVLARFRAKADDPKVQAKAPLIRLETRIIEGPAGMVAFTLEKPEAEIGRQVVPFETLISGFRWGTEKAK